MYENVGLGDLIQTGLDSFQHDMDMARMTDAADIIASQNMLSAEMTRHQMEIEANAIQNTMRRQAVISIFGMGDYI